MYSVVLATMLAAGSSTPAWHCHSSCYSCYSGYSGYSCYSGYSGYSCYGCHGCHGYRLYSVIHHHYCHGCYSCYSCSSCCGGVVYYGCHLCCGGATYSSCHGCCGGVITSPPMVVPIPGAPPAKKVTEEKKSAASAPTTSRVIVMLPSDAKLWVDNVECPLTSAVRSFDTPLLDPSQKYTYNLKVQMVRDGRTVTETQRAVITPGQPVQVDFTAVASTASRE